MKKFHSSTICTGHFPGLAVLFPQLFHLTGIGGTVLLPMHIPVLLAGLLVCPAIGLYVE